MVDMSGNYTFDYDLSNVTPNINESTAFMSWTNLSWSSAMSGFDPWIAAMGEWFWVYVVVSVTGAVMIKYREVFPAAFVLTALSSVCIAAMPPVVEQMFYAMMVLGLIGMLYGIFSRK